MASGTWLSICRWATNISTSVSRGRARGPAPLYLDQTEARRAEKCFFWDGPSYLKVKVWISLYISQFLDSLILFQMFFNLIGCVTALRDRLTGSLGFSLRALKKKWRDFNIQVLEKSLFYNPLLLSLHTWTELILAKNSSSFGDAAYSSDTPGVNERLMGRREGRIISIKWKST